MVGVGGVERARESIRNDDLRTLFFVLLFIRRRGDMEDKVTAERRLRSTRMRSENDLMMKGLTNVD